MKNGKGIGCSQAFRHSTFFAGLPLPCIIVNANGRPGNEAKNWRSIAGDLDPTRYKREDICGPSLPHSQVDMD